MNKPVFEHMYAGKHFKIYENGTVNVGDIPSNLPKDAEIIINRLHQYKYGDLVRIKILIAEVYRQAREEELTDADN